MPLPVKLKKPPLLETSFEIRFEAAKVVLADLLPGILYQTLSTEYPDSASLPLASVPREIRSRDPNLAYIAAHRLLRPDGNIFIGDRVVGVGHVAPYQGWDQFRARIDALLKALKPLPFIARAERFSIRSINLLEAPPAAQLGLLNLNVQIAGQSAPTAGFQLRTEFVKSPDITILSIATNATTSSSTPSQDAASSKTGLVVDVDAIRLLKAPEFWHEIEAGIDQVHMRLKEMFFSLLTKATLESLGPEY